MNKLRFKIFFTAAILLNSMETFAQSQQLRSVKIETEGFWTETIFDVSCESFDLSFKETKKCKFFNNPKDLLKFETMMKNFKPSTWKSFDVRGTVTYRYNRAVEKYCFDVFGHFYKDGKLYYNKNLLIAISDKVYNDHPKYLDTIRQL
jgi:hypothetical protein